MQTFDVLSPDGEPLFLANFLNEKKAKLEEHERPRHRWVRNQEELDAFLRQHDILGRATYHTVAKLKPGSWRKKENVHATLFIWAETDFKDHPGLGREEICRRIEAIPDRIKPTFCVFSGHGVHLYWLLKEPEDASPGEAQRRIEEALALACNYIGGDPHVVDTARLLRTPGSHNTREPGESLPVRFEAVEMSRRYDLGDLVDLWLEAHPILPSPIKTNGHAQGAFDYQPGGSEGPTAEGPVHIEVRLAAMRFKGRGDTAINPTQLAATASLTGAGRPIVETVAKVLAATQAAVKDDDRCVSWDWAAEEAEILRMCYGLVNKAMEENGEDLSHTLPDDLYDQWQQALQQGKRPQICGGGARRAHVRGFPWETKSTTDDTQEDERSEEPPRDEPKEEHANGRTTPGNLLGSAWYFGDPVPEQPPMLVPFLIPARGFGYLGGQWGTMKTFILNDLSVAVASNGKFAGQQVSGPGVVIQIELEGSHNEARMFAAACVRQCRDERLPIVHLKKEPPKILINGQPNPRFREWIVQLAEFAKAVAVQFDLPTALITIDPQNKVAGFKDEQSSSEGQFVSDAFSELAKMAECTVLVSDHFGKDPSAGLRGTSVKETNPLFILNTSEQQKDVYARRQLEIRKMRNGPSGLAIEFWMEDQDVVVDQIVRNEDNTTSVQPATVKTLVIRWGEGLRPISQTGGRVSRNEVPPTSQRALAVLAELIEDVGIALPGGCNAPLGQRGIPLSIWRQALVKEGVIGGPKPHVAFTRIREALSNHQEIETSEEFAWIPLTQKGSGVL
jgi:hypothetical protein